VRHVCVRIAQQRHAGRVSEQLHRRLPTPKWVSGPSANPYGAGGAGRGRRTCGTCVCASPSSATLDG
jgi:hypothetical protein